MERSDVVSSSSARVFVVDDEPVVALISGTDRLDEKQLAAVANGTRTRRATPGEVLRHTGFTIGGVPPFGHVSNLRCFLDDALLSQPVVWAAAGTPTHVFSVSPGALGLAASARIATLREPHVR